MEATTGCLTDQITFDMDGNIPNSNATLLSVNEGNQLVANLHFLLANGLVTIQTEESLLSQSTSIDNSHNHRPAIVSDSSYASTLHVSPGNLNDNAKDSVNLGQMLKLPQSPSQSSQSYQLQSNNCLSAGAASTTRVEPFPKVSLQAPLPMNGSKSTVTKGSSSKRECNICGKIFTKPYQVERHKRIHTGERPYKCDLCTKSFAQKSTLQMHQKHHTGDRPYHCPYCEYSFTQKGNLRTHVKRVHQLDTADAKKLKRTCESFLPKVLQDNLTEVKALNLDDISFVEFLK